MSYCMSQMEADFCIKKENIENVLRTIKELSNEQKLDWVINENIQAAKTLENIFSEIRWCFEIYDNGDIEDINFEGEKLGSEDKIFSAIAPYVQDGSYIQMEGEEGSIWRWVFKDGECQEINPTISW